MVVSILILLSSLLILFFSLLRKVFIIVPLSLLLPGLGFGVNGVYIAEPVSNLVAGISCFLVMYFTVYRKLPADGMEAHL